MPQKINISSFSSKDNLYLVAGAQVIWKLNKTDYIIQP